MPVIAFGRGRTELKQELRRLEPSWFHQITCLKRGGCTGSLAAATDSLISTPLGQFLCLIVRSCWTTGGGKNGVCGVVNITTIDLISPPQSGQVTVLDHVAFTYMAKLDFQGQDSFSLQVSAAIKKVNGTSTIRIVVSIIGR